MTINKQSGMTLVEIIISIVVIGVVFSAISTLYISIQDIQAKSAYLEAATRAAQREIEVLRNNNYNNLTAGQSIDFTAQLPSLLPKGAAGTAAITEPTPGLKRVDVTVSYKQGGRTNQVILSSTIGIIGITK